MNDTIIKLKSEILHLNNLNSLLKEDNEEKRLEIGHLKSNQNTQKLQQDIIKREMQQNNIQQIVYDSLQEANNKYDKLQSDYNKLLEQEAFSKNRMNDAESFIHKLQIENNDLKRQLVTFSSKHEAVDYMNMIQSKENEIKNKEENYQNMILEVNELRRRMEEVIQENRVLRQIGNVPENFGVDISKIKLEEKILIEDYKVKIRLLKNQIDLLESERAQLKESIRNKKATGMKDPPFNRLTPEQINQVIDYAEGLLNGNDIILPEKYELIQQFQKEKIKNEILEKQLSNERFNKSYNTYNQSKQPETNKEISQPQPINYNVMFSNNAKPKATENPQYYHSNIGISKDYSNDQLSQSKDSSAKTTCSDEPFIIRRNKK